MTVRVYRSSDASAPVMNGTSGSLLAVFDACLVNGYGALAAAGWTKDFSGTNLAAYRPPSGNRFIFRLDDTGSQEGRCLGYESMSSISVGVGGFPTNAQISGGLFIRKSSTADSTARPWVMIASATAFHFIPMAALTLWTETPAAVDCSGHMFFGDLLSFKPGDAYGTAIIAATLTGPNNGAWPGTPGVTTTFSPGVGHYIARAYTQVGGSIQASKAAANLPTNQATVLGGAGAPWPDPMTGGLIISPVWMSESGPLGGNSARGFIPGMWCPGHNKPAIHGDSVSGSGDTAGKSFLIVWTYNTSTSGSVLVETTNNW